MNDRVDDLGVPACAVSDEDRDGFTVGDEPASGDTRLVAAVFEGLLGVPQVGAGDGFFDLGGDSLLAVGVVSRLAAATGRELPVRAVFGAPDGGRAGAGTGRGGGGRCADRHRAGGSIRSAAAVVPAGALVVPLAAGRECGGRLRHCLRAATVRTAGRGGAGGGAARGGGTPREPADAVCGGGRPSGAGDRGVGSVRAGAGGRVGLVRGGADRACRVAGGGAV